MTNVSGRLSQPQFLPLSLARAVWKHRLLVVCAWLLLTGTGVYIARHLPAIYKAEALILVDPQKVPERFVATTVTEDLQDRLATISQEIQSTPRLQAIINELGLYRAARRTHAREDVINMMRKDIEIKVEKGRAFRISYQASDPQTAARVVNRITALYMDENLKDRETQAEGTTEFLENQLSEAKRTLEKQEEAVSQYKVAHNGALPEQENSLSSTLARLQVELQGNQDATNRTQQDKITLESSLAAAENAEASLRRASQVRASAAMAGSGYPAVSTSDGNMAALKGQLAQLLERYTDDYPEVEALRTKIARLERARLMERREQEQLAAQPRPKTPPVDAPEPALDSADLTAAHERVLSLRAQLAAAKRQLDQQAADRSRIIASISSAEGRIGQLPLREQEMASLTRDYEISKSNYQSLQDKKNAAVMAGDLEHRQKAERFRILDPAKPPELPTKPNRHLLYLASLVGGLILSFAFAIGLELRKAVLLGHWELPKDVDVLASIPEIAPAAKLVSKAGGESRPLNAGALASLLWAAAFPALLAALKMLGRN